MSGLPTHVSGVFENLLTVTLGIMPTDDARAKGDPTLRGLPAAVVRAVGEELTTAEDGDPTDPVLSEAAAALRDMDEFDRRLAAGAAADEGGSSTAKKRHSLATGADPVIASLPVRRKAPIGTKGLAWSPEAPALAEEIEASRRQGGGASLHRFTGRTFLYGRFSSLKLVNMRIGDMDGSTSSFRGLRHLNVSGNRIAALQNLPRGLRTLQAYGNEIRAVIAAPPCPSCSHAGLGYNRISDCRALAAALPGLASLDLSWNAVEDLGGALSALAALRPTLRFLEMSGNPCALLPGYRGAVKAALGPAAGGALEQLDGIPVDEEEGPGGGATGDAEGAELAVELLRVTGVPLPADVEGWAEAAAEVEAAKAGAKKGGGKKSAKKGATPEVSPRPVAEPWEVAVDARPIAAAESGEPVAESERVSGGGMADALSGRPGVWARSVVRGRADTALRDALAVRGLTLTLLLRKAEAPADEAGTAGATGPDGAAVPAPSSGASADARAAPAVEGGGDGDDLAGQAEEVVLGTAEAGCGTVLEARPEAAAAGSDPEIKAPLRLTALPAATREAVLLVSRAAVRREAATAAAEAAGGKKGKKAEAPSALTEEQEADAAARAATACEELISDASACVIVRVSLVR